MAEFMHGIPGLARQLRELDSCKLTRVVVREHKPARQSVRRCGPRTSSLSYELVATVGTSVKRRMKSKTSTMILSRS